MRTAGPGQHRHGEGDEATHFDARGEGMPREGRKKHAPSLVKLRALGKNGEEWSWLG